MSLAGKKILITGGAQGIGRGLAERFLAEGARVMIADIDDAAGRETEQELQAAGEVRFFRADVASEEEVGRLVAQTLNTFGGLDVLINNAGIMIRRPLTELSLAEWNRVLAVNLSGAFLCARACAPALRQTKGALLNIASTRALMSEADTESYAASKGGLLALTHALAVSLGPQVRVNCISPGWIDVSGWAKKSDRVQEELSAADHAQHPAGRVGTPQDIASLAVFLCRSENSFITGQNFVVDGGMTRKMIYVE